MEISKVFSVVKATLEIAGLGQLAISEQVCQAVSQYQVRLGKGSKQKKSVKTLTLWSMIVFFSDLVIQSLVWDDKYKTET